MLLNRNGNSPVTVLRDGRVVTVPYRRAVGWISVGRAQWWTPDTITAPAPPPLVPEEGPELTELPVGTPVKAPEKPVTPPVSVVHPPVAPVSTPAAVKAAEPVKPKSKSAVSVPTRKGAEDDLTGYEPSPPDQ